MDEIVKTINEITYEVLKDRIKFEEITPSKHIVDDLLANSGDVLEIMLMILSEFNLDQEKKLSRKKMRQLTTMENLYAFICEAIKKPA